MCARPRSHRGWDSFLTFQNLEKFAAVLALNLALVDQLLSNKLKFQVL